MVNGTCYGVQCTVTYTCNSGYRLVGSSVAICNATSSTLLTPPPTCVPTVQGTCSNSPSTGNVAGFTGAGYCGCSDAVYSTIYPANVAACGAACLNDPNCAAFVFYSECWWPVVTALVTTTYCSGCAGYSLYTNGLFFN